MRSTYRRRWAAALGCALACEALPAAQHAAAFTTTTITLQQGVDGYDGTFDRRIGLAGNGPVNGADVDTNASSFFLDGGPTAADRADYLIRFDGLLGKVPAGAKIISSELALRTTSENVSTNSQSNGAWNIYELTAPFDGTATFENFANGNGGGIDGDVATINGSFEGQTVADSLVAARVDRTVQRWVDGAANHGFGVRSDRSGDGWSIHTTGSATQASRPQLSVTYTTDPSVRIAAYQSTLDTFPNGHSGDTVGTITNGASLEQAFLDGNNGTDSFDQPYLVRFDDVPLNFAQIVRAELVLVTGFASSAADSPAPWTIHQVLTDWNAETTYASLDRDGNPALSESPELVANGVLAPAATVLPSVQDTEVVHLDVTAIAQAWLAGSPNYGIYIGAEPGNANGWQIFTSGAADVSFRPELRIVGVVPEPGALALTSCTALWGAGVARRRRG